MKRVNGKKGITPPHPDKKNGNDGGAKYKE
jgi:hypothetical protein